MKPLRTILQQEITLAAEEIRRPISGLAVSGLIAGFALGTSLLAIAALSPPPATDSTPLQTLLLASAYSVGFILVIIGRTDLFTEYTTLAILPVLTGVARVRQLARLWAAVYIANICGALLFAVMLASLLPALHVAESGVLIGIAERLLAANRGHMLLSASLAGWLMGLVSWLVAASRSTTSQIICIWLVTMIIGIGHLHHSILGCVEVMSGVILSPTIAVSDLGSFLLWTTLGNAIGGGVFAVLIRVGMTVGDDAAADGDDGSGGGAEDG